jgi:hypothetical protein
MIGGVVFLLVSLTLLTVLGLAVLAPMRRSHREVLLPAAPVLGAALLAVVLSSTSYLVPAGGGVVVTLVVAAGLVVTAALRRTRPWRVGRGPIGLAVLALVLGVPGCVVSLLPSIWLGGVGAVSPNQSHDAFYYVSEAAWLDGNAISPVPQLGAAPEIGAVTPGYAPLTGSLALPLRIGQPMVQAALNAVTGQDAAASAMAVSALWVLLVAPAAFTAARLLRTGTWAAGVLAVMSASSALLVQQVYQQNVDALLGVGLALLTVGLCLAAVRRRVPVLPASLALAALVSVYTEYALYVGPAVVGGVLLTRRRGWWRRLRTALVAVALGVLIAPSSWVRGVGTVLIRRDGDLADSPLFSDGWSRSLARTVGTMPLGSTGEPGPLTLLLTGVLAAGLLLSLVVAHHRGAWLGLLTVGLGYVAVLTAGHHGYTQMRAVSLLLPLLLLAAVAGWAGLVRLLVHRTRPRRAPGRRHARVRTRRAVAAVAASLVAVAALAVVVNLRAAPASLDRALVESRSVDADFREAARWVAAHGGDEGEDVTVVAPDLFDQMWLAYVLRDDDLVSYASLRPDYLRTGQFWAGETDPWLLVGRGAVVDAPDGAVVEENDRFRLVDTSVGPVTAVVPGPAAAQWYPFAPTGPDGTSTGMIGPDLGTVLLWRSDLATGDVEVTLRVPSAQTVSVAIDGGEPVSLPVVDQQVGIPVGADVPSGAVLTVDLGGDGVADGTQFELEGVHRAG